MKTNFYNKNYSQSLAFIMRFQATWKWPILNAPTSVLPSGDVCVKEIRVDVKIRLGQILYFLE